MRERRNIAAYLEELFGEKPHMLDRLDDSYRAIYNPYSNHPVRLGVHHVTKTYT